MIDMVVQRLRKLTGLKYIWINHMDICIEIGCTVSVNWVWIETWAGIKRM